MSEKKFNYLTVGKNGSVWALGKEDGQIYSLGGDAGMVGWFADKDGRAESLAVSTTGEVWAVNKIGEIWRMTGANMYGNGGTWAQVTTKSSKKDAKSIAASADGNIWYTQTDDVIVHTKAPTKGAQQPTWVTGPAGGKAVSLAPFTQEILYCVNKEGQIWLFANGEWSQTPTNSNRPDAKMISVGTDQASYYVDQAGAIFRHVMPGDGVGLPLWDKWENPPMGKVAIVAVSDRNLVWCLNTKGEVWRTIGNEWKQLVESTGAVWTYTVKPGDTLNAIVMKEFKLTGATEITQKAKQIVADSGLADGNSLKPGDVLTLHS